MSATLDDIESAIFAALVPKRMPDGGSPTLARPFRLVDRWEAQVTGANIVAQHLAQTPSALLAFERSTVVQQNGYDLTTTLGGGVEVVEDFFFRVYVTVVDVRSKPAFMLKGDGTNAGIFGCTQVVVEALAALPIEGLYRGDTLHFIERVPWQITNGNVTHLVRFRARAAVPDGEPAPLPGNPMTGIDATIASEQPAADGTRDVLATARTRRIL